MCCKVYGIPEIEKPAGQWCRHCRPGAGCSIYPDRPQMCRDFDCCWLIDPTMPDMWKPERSHIVLSIFPRNGFLYALVDPATPQAWRKAPYFDYLRQMAVRLEESNRRVIVFVVDDATLVTSRGVVPLGRVGPDRTYAIRMAFGPDGPTYFLAGTQTLNR